MESEPRNTTRRWEYMNNNKKEHNKKKKVTSKQIVAIIGVVLLVLLYLITLIVSFTDNSSSGQLFQICLFATIAIPFLIWIYIWMYGKLTQKHTIADLDIGGQDKTSHSEQDKSK